MTSTDASSCATVERELAFRNDLTSVISFESYGTATPEPASRLIALLAHWPYVSSDDTMLFEQDLAAPYSPTEEEFGELRAAADLARTVGTARIEMCSDVEAAAWQTLVNIPMLQPLLQATFSAEQALTFTQDSLWDVGPNRFPHLSHPKPGVAFGLAFANGGGSPLSRQLITDLVHVSGIPLTYSPSIQRLIYPSVILEAKSAWESIKVAESQLAVGAARALALLAELSKLSAVPFQHCVVVIATQGSLWKLFVAYQDLDDRATVNIVPVLRSVLQIELERDRQRLAFIIHRLKAWMLGPYRSKISEQLSFVQENGLQQMQHLRPDQRLTSPTCLIDDSLRYMLRTVHQSEQSFEVESRGACRREEVG